MRRIAACLLLLTALCSLPACAVPEEPVEEQQGQLIYYLVPQEEAQGGDCIRGQYEDLGLPEDAPVGEVAQAVVERLLAGPAEGELLSPLPEGVELLSVVVRDRWAYVDLSSDFNQLSGVALSLADYCLTLSLGAIEGINAVSVTAQGRSVGQQPRQVFYERDVLLSDMDDVLHTEEVTLYFLNAAGELTGERRTIEVYEGQTLAENLLAALLAGPEDRELSRVIPEDFQVSFVRVDSGVCYVSIPQASLATLPGDEAQQRLILWSLADSLYSLDTVQELRLLSEGEELTAFGQIGVEEVAVRPVG